MGHKGIGHNIHTTQDGYTENKVQGTCDTEDIGLAWYLAS